MSDPGRPVMDQHGTAWPLTLFDSLPEASAQALQPSPCEGTQQANGSSAAGDRSKVTMVCWWNDHDPGGSRDNRKGAKGGVKEPVHTC